jgi:hypothetical protein
MLHTHKSDKIILLYIQKCAILESMQKTALKLAGTVMGYGLDSFGSIPGRTKRLFPFPQHPDWLWETPSHPMGTGAPFLELKGTGA